MNFLESHRQASHPYAPVFFGTQRVWASLAQLPMTAADWKPNQGWIGGSWNAPAARLWTARRRSAGPSGAWSPSPPWRASTPRRLKTAASRPAGGPSRHPPPPPPSSASCRVPTPAWPPSPERPPPWLGVCKDLQAQLRYTYRNICLQDWGRIAIYPVVGIFIFQLLSFLQRSDTRVAFLTGEAAALAGGLQALASSILVPQHPWGFARLW